MLSETIFLVLKTYSSALLEVLHLLIPLCVVMPEPSMTGVQLPEFYVRRPVLEPRRPESLDKDDDSWTKVLVVREAGRPAGPADLGQPSQDNICRP